MLESYLLSPRQEYTNDLGPVLPRCNMNLESELRKLQAVDL
eukprot:XP_001704353.1 Hypothetical protein GL50803_26775 [Giardia lamblia ATCC 50803]